jgi:8-oxo-dGTP pyrophosphatase MutT (NUDIX family)
MTEPPPPDGYPPLPRPEEPVVQECVEGYLFSRSPMRVMVFQRTPARGSIWVPIQGKVEPSDPSFEAALRRELREETGLERPLAVTALDWHVPFRDERGDVWRLHAYAVEVPTSFRPRLNEENVASEWVDADEAVRRLHFTDNREAVRRLVERLVPASPNV